MRAAGRFLQLAGLVILPLGMLFGLSGEGGRAMTLELGCLGAGAAIFFAGYLLQKRS